VDVRLIEVDQPMPVVLGTGQPILHPPDKGLPPLRISSAQQLAGRLPRQIEAVQGTADRLTAAATTKPRHHPANQAAQGPAWRRISPS
jgi:hypothetical protein